MLDTSFDIRRCIFLGLAAQSLNPPPPACRELRGSNPFCELLLTLADCKSLCWTPPLPPTLVGWNTFFSPPRNFFNVLSIFLPFKISSKIRSLKQPFKNSKIRPLSAQSLILRSFWECFCLSQNLLFCYNYNAKCMFLHFKASHFGIKNQSQKHVFSRRLPGHLFL